MLSAPRLESQPLRSLNSRASAAEPLILITCEYPPDLGGVSDYTEALAGQLAAAGMPVEVWTPGKVQSRVTEGNLTICRGPDRYGRSMWSQIGKSLAKQSGGAGGRVLVQWVPHGYGARGLNVGFCAWLLWRRLAHRDRISIMFHEPGLGFEGGWRHNAAALIQRLMAALMLRAATRVSITIPEWRTRLEPLALGKKLNWRWIPVPSNVPVTDDPAAVARLRARCCAPSELLFGHFGTFHGRIGQLVRAAVPALLRATPTAHMLLFGSRSLEFREELATAFPEFAPRLWGAGKLNQEELSQSLSACDVMIQPYPDGVSTRRGSMMAALSHGRPTVTTTGWLTEPFWREVDAVMTVPADGEINAVGESIARAAASLAASPERRLAIGQSAFNLYEQRFALSHTVQAVIEELERL